MLAWTVSLVSYVYSAIVDQSCICSTFIRKSARRTCNDIDIRAESYSNIHLSRISRNERWVKFITSALENRHNYKYPEIR
jgi:hypothetical protein